MIATSFTKTNAKRCIAEHVVVIHGSSPSPHHSPCFPHYLFLVFVAHELMSCVWMQVGAPPYWRTHCAGHATYHCCLVIPFLTSHHSPMNKILCNANSPPKTHSTSSRVTLVFVCCCCGCCCCCMWCRWCTRIAWRCYHGQGHLFSLLSLYLVATSSAPLTLAFYQWMRFFFFFCTTEARLDFHDFCLR